MQRFARGHRGLFLILLGQAALWWHVVASGSPWATGTLECTAGTIAEVLLNHPRWPILDTFQGALGGPFLLALSAMPFYLILGVSPLASKMAVYCTAVGLVLIVYFLLDRNESRLAALLAAASFSFLPPSLFFASAAFGNLHWTQLLFDYGMVLFGLEILRRDGGVRAWAGFGFVAGLSLFHSPGSLPFVGIAVLGTWVVARPSWKYLAAALLASLVGASLFIYKLFFYDAFGVGVGSGEQTISRLRPRSFDLTEALTLVYPEAAEGLLFHQTMEQWPLSPGWAIATLWTAVGWVGLSFLVVSLARSESRRKLDLSALLLSAIPLLFIAVYVVAICSIPGARLLGVTPDFENMRGAGFRNLPMLWAALLLASSIGWSRAAKSAWQSPLGRGAVLVACVPACCGVLGQISIVENQAPPESASLNSFRVECFDALGVFAASSLKSAPWRSIEACELLETTAARSECAVGAAWGVGMERTGIPAEPSEVKPKQFDGPSFEIQSRARDACALVPEQLVNECYFGVGWTVGRHFWGNSRWPSTACDSLPEGDYRDACWRGMGFAVGDHLHPSPRGMSRVLDMVPPDRRDDVAVGAGIGLGRGFGDRGLARSFCEQMKSDSSAWCVRGVERTFVIRETDL